MLEFLGQKGRSVPFIACCLAMAAAALISATTLVAASDAWSPYDEELPTHRLPTQVRPLHYGIDLDFSRGTHATYKWSGYQGTVNISVEFTGPDNSRLGRCFNRVTGHAFAKSSSDDDEASASATCLPRPDKRNRIVLHADESIRIKSVRVFKQLDSNNNNDDGKAPAKLQKLKIAEQGRDAAKQLIYLDMVSDLPRAGSRGLIEFTFEVDARTDLHGIYRISKATKGLGAAPFQAITAKFQPTFARLALPCFDEPSFKAKFSLSFKYPDGNGAYANTELAETGLSSTGARVSKFKTTPRMSIHMLAFTIGTYDEPLELQVRDNLRLRAITPKGKRLAGAYALEVAKFSIEHFEKYIDYEFPLEKMDIVAIPETDTDNTETWGLTFVRDYVMLIDDETKEDTKITTAVNVAHICVHTWFANLITAVWWDDMWITESVAAQMAYELVAQLFPDQSDYFVRISTLSAILVGDSTGKLHSLSPPASELKTSDKIYELFDIIQFQKSGALSRLQQDTLGYEEYRKVLQTLVRKHAFGNVEFGDMVRAIANVPTSKDWPMVEILTSWSKLRSYPVINVDFNGDSTKLVLYQEHRPLAKPSVQRNYNPPSPFTLPIQVLFSDASAQHQEILNVTLGAGAASHAGYLALPSWFVVGRDWAKVNAGPDLSTYYRIRYSDEALAALRPPVETQQLDTMNRLHLLDDSKALAASGLMTPQAFNQVLSWHANETTGAMIIEMLLATQTLLSLTPNVTSPVSGAFMNLYTQHGFEVRGDETLLEQRARMSVLKVLVNRAIPDVVQAALKTFDESNGNVALFLREPVYAAVVSSGTDEQVNQLLEHYKATQSYEEQVRLASALSLSHNPSILVDLNALLHVSGLTEAVVAPIREAIKNSLKAATGWPNNMNDDVTTAAPQE